MLKINTKIYSATGIHSNNSNLTLIGYCLEPPKEVLKYAFKKNFRIGGYRQIGQIQPFGEGLVIRGTDMEPLAFGLTVTAHLDDLKPKLCDLRQKYELINEEFSNEDLIRMFSSGNLKVWKGGEYQSLFNLSIENLTNEQKVVRDIATEFVEVLRRREVSFTYLLSLYRKVYPPKNR